MLSGKQIALDKINLKDKKFAKASFEIGDEYTLIAFIYTEKQQLLNAIEALKSDGIVYDSVYTPLQETEKLCTYASQYYFCDIDKVYKIKNIHFCI